jgi:hypothetical protein
MKVPRKGFASLRWQKQKRNGQMKMKLTILMLALTAGIAHATLVGSLHYGVNDDTNGVDRLSGLATRTSDGDADTRGTVQGEIKFLAGTSLGTGGYAGATFDSYSGVCHFRDLNRYAGSAGGLITFDYDLTGVVNEGVFKLALDFTYRSTVNDTQFYISYSNGSTLTLDTTDISTTPSHGATAIVGDTSKYTQIATLTGASGTMEIDLTSIITTAQANGGGVRLAYVDNNYLGDVRFQNESGIVTTIPEPATLGLVGLFGVATLFIRRRLML